MFWSPGPLGRTISSTVPSIRPVQLPNSSVFSFTFCANRSTLRAAYPAPMSPVMRWARRSMSILTVFKNISYNCDVCLRNKVSTSIHRFGVVWRFNTIYVHRNRLIWYVLCAVEKFFEYSVIKSKTTAISDRRKRKWLMQAPSPICSYIHYWKLKSR